MSKEHWLAYIRKVFVMSCYVMNIINQKHHSMKDSNTWRMSFNLNIIFCNITVQIVSSRKNKMSSLVMIALNLDFE